ncbi:hypothetical protein [Streptomyces sp. 5112.2]|uniref:hypothetical protein n=1 Tax=unclassified Streptomyces TaxID=2593676 RepID=UPI0015A439D6|nr:hypothetical protein [Streptomyces sp. 5112.2]
MTTAVVIPAWSRGGASAIPAAATATPTAAVPKRQRRVWVRAQCAAWSRAARSTSSGRTLTWARRALTVAVWSCADSVGHSPTTAR